MNQIVNQCQSISLVPIGQIKFHPKNRNKHPQDQLERLAKIIQYQGVRRPATISNRSGFLTVGEGRVKAAKLAGVTEYPVIYQDYDSEEQEYADIQADNAVGLWAEIDLAGVNQDLADLGPDFDLDMLGIKDFTLEPSDKYADKDADAVPEVPEEPVTKLGDLWMLGDHRVLCGDCTDPKNIERLMQGEKADMVFTDPPYNVDYQGHDNERWSQKHRKIENDCMSAEDFDLFTKAFSKMFGKITDGCLYVCGHPGPDGRIMFGNLDSQYHCSTTIVWNKDRLVLGRGKYHNKYEPIWFGWVDSGRGFISDRDLVNVWDFKRPSSSDLHPTMKPVELIEQAIKHASKKSVADPFLGSGSTLIACEKTGRKCYGMEIDPHYCDVIVKRWEEFTGKKAMPDGAPIIRKA